MLGNLLGSLGYGNGPLFQGGGALFSKGSFSFFQLHTRPLHLGLTFSAFGPHLLHHLQHKHKDKDNKAKEQGLKQFKLSWLGSSRFVKIFDWSGDPSKRRILTNIFIGLNILIFAAQEATNGRLLFWGAKVNSLIDRGQFWRLVTSAFLHANIGHLLVNCYSLNSLGPAVEALEGPKRFFAVYIASAVAGSSMSYLCSREPAVGASGAIFGLASALAVFFLRHKNLINEAPQRLSQIGKVIAINLVLGLISNNIDNWGHIGGLLGGAAVSWLLGPALTWEYPPKGGEKILVDRPPISFLIPPKK